MMALSKGSHTILATEVASIGKGHSKVVVRPLEFIY